jgi:transposase InsO family protein
MRGATRNPNVPNRKFTAELPNTAWVTDVSSPYASDDYRAALAEREMVVSMSRKGDCWDNAVAESFFGTLKGELVDHEVYATREAATASIGDYIDEFYNIERRHSSIGYISPIEFELKLQSKKDLRLRSREKAA